MNTVYLRRSDPTVERIIQATFPSFTGQKVEAIVTDSVTFHSTQWDEGYKRDYRILRLSDMKSLTIPEAPFMQRSPDHETAVQLPDGFVVVVYVHTRLDRIEIISSAGNITPLLTQEVVLSEDERTVLIATRSRKSSYAGVSNYRFHEARRARGITLDRWEAAKAALIEKKLLNKAGAITVEGRNAVGMEQL